MTGDILGAKKKENGGGGTALYYGIAENPTGWRRDVARWFGIIYTLA
jgi:hypothetical protein